MNIQFNEERHEYSVDGVIVPSVSEIIKPLTFETAVNSKPWLRDIAADRGTRVHQATMLMDYGEAPDIDPDTAGYIKAYQRFLNDYKPKWEGIETLVYHDGFQYAGTVDRYGYIDGEACLVDIKTGTYNKYPMSAQLAGYTLALGKMMVFRAERAFDLMLTKYGTYEIKEIDHNGAYLFADCMNIYNTTKRRKR